MSKTEKSYTRGPYKRSKQEAPKEKTILYRTKTTTPATDQDCEALFNYLQVIKADIKSKFSISHNRSKILENLQGLSDYIKKQINKKSINNQERIEELKAELNKLEQKQLNLEDIIINPNPENLTLTLEEIDNLLTENEEEASTSIKSPYKPLFDHINSKLPTD